MARSKERVAVRQPEAELNDEGRDTARYVAFPKALRSLAARLDATPDELAMWIWLGPRDGGLAAYLNVNELDPPPRFFFPEPSGSLGRDEHDYLAFLMACWFREDDVATFVPSGRYVTGAHLIERWHGHPGLQAEPFILAKIAESRLQDVHPLFGGTQGTFPDELDFPPLAAGLFKRAEIELIEAEDLGGWTFTSQEGARGLPGDRSGPPESPKERRRRLMDLVERQRHIDSRKFLRAVADREGISIHALKRVIYRPEPKQDVFEQVSSTLSRPLLPRSKRNGG